MPQHGACRVIGLQRVCFHCLADDAVTFTGLTVEESS